MHFWRDMWPELLVLFALTAMAGAIALTILVR